MGARLSSRRGTWPRDTNPDVPRSDGQVYHQQRSGPAENDTSEVNGNDTSDVIATITNTTEPSNLFNITDVTNTLPYPLFNATSNSTSNSTTPARTGHLISPWCAGGVNDKAGYPLCNTHSFEYTVYYGGAFYGMACLAAALLILCALLAGLTLAICGLDMTWVQLKSISASPKEKKQLRAVARMKRHHTWMLCSLILCSVACGESFPFVIQSIYAGDQIWVPILTSTVAIALFAELLPQYFIPQQAVEWGYYCRPLIWGCMLLTCIITYPLACILDRIAHRKDEYKNTFTNLEIGAIVKYHERKHGNGGRLGPDAARIMIGALYLDSRKIGGVMSTPIEPESETSEKDLERAESRMVHGMIVDWHAVKAVDINERIDKIFIEKVKSWSYSRIPVLGKSMEMAIEEATTGKSAWDKEDTKIYGFFHIKSLLAIDLTKSNRDSERGLLVKDLPLYPLPIVRDDMPVYELLNLFQMGMSRMAIVVPSPPRDPIHVIKDSSKSKGAIWTAKESINAKIISKMKTARSGSDCVTNYLTGSPTIFDEKLGRQIVLGVRSLEPIGIVTYEDIIDTILQKTSRDEKDFFDRENGDPPTKRKKVGDYVRKPIIGGIIPNSTVSIGTEVPVPKPKAQFSLRHKKSGTLRKRFVSSEKPKDKHRGGLDGADETSILDFAMNDDLAVPKKKQGYAESSYTDNSAGGFHGPTDSDSAMGPGTGLTKEDFAELANTSSTEWSGNPYSMVQSTSLPSRKIKMALGRDSVQTTMRHASASPALPTLRRIGSFYGESFTSFEKGDDQDLRQLIIPTITFTTPTTQENTEVDYEDSILSFSAVTFHDQDLGDTFYGSEPGNTLYDLEIDDSVQDFDDAHPREQSADTVTASSFLLEVEGSETPVYDAFPVPAKDFAPKTEQLKKIHTIQGEHLKAYEGFPVELLEKEKETCSSKYASRTMPRALRVRDTEEVRKNAETPAREEDFHDDRAMLPSQRRSLSGGPDISPRSSSLWW